MDRNALAAGVMPRACDFARWYARSIRHLEEHLTDTATEAVVRALNTYDPSQGEFEPFAMGWVTRMVRRQAQLWFARRDSQPEEKSFYLDPSDPEPFDPVDTAPSTSTCLSLELMELPKRLMLPVFLYFLEGYTLVETGRIMGISESTVRLRLEQAAARIAGSNAARPKKTGRFGREKRTRAQLRIGADHGNIPSTGTAPNGTRRELRDGPTLRP